MAPSTSRPPKGKQADQTGTWSESKWDEGRQRWYNDRIGPTGEIEYHYHEESPTTNDPKVPRGNVSFGTQDTSPSIAYQNPSSYSSSGTGGTTYPPVGENYTTSTGGASWPGSNSAYSSAYPAQTPRIDTSTDNYGGSIGSSSTPYPPYGSSQHGTGSTFTQYGTGHLADDSYSTNSSNCYASPDSDQENLQGLTSGLSSMTLGPLAEGGTVQYIRQGNSSLIDINLASSSQMPVPKPIFREPGSKNYETLDRSMYEGCLWHGKQGLSNLMNRISSNPRERATSLFQSWSSVHDALDRACWPTSSCWRWNTTEWITHQHNLAW
jgi:hypothetical protein